MFVLFGSVMSGPQIAGSMRVKNIYDSLYLELCTLVIAEKLKQNTWQCINNNHNNTAISDPNAQAVAALLLVALHYPSVVGGGGGGEEERVGGWEG